MVLRGSQLGVCSRDPPSEYNRADHQEGLAWCKCACVRVYTHTRVCCQLRLGEEFRVSAKEPGADTAGILLRSHSPLYQFPLAAVKIITPLWLRTTDTCSLTVLEAGVQSHWTEN